MLFLGKLDDDTADADLVEGADPIGDIFSDLLAGAGALLTEGIKIVTDVTDGSVSSVPYVPPILGQFLGDLST